jgi:N-acetylneuraminate synthase
MIEAMARYRLPILIATGAASIEEVKRAIAAARRHEDRIVVMQCNTNYTVSLENFRHIALNVLKTYAREFPDTVLGLSDHTPGCATVLGAVTLGARVIEKHFTDDRGREGPDHAFSMDPADWREMVERTRELESALGTEEKRIMEN